MTREELIRSLRICAGENGGSCYGCAVEASLDCSEKLVQAAADMLESDLHEIKSEKMDVETRNCSGIRCPMQNGTVDPAHCQVMDCPNFTAGAKTADEMFRELGYKGYTSYGNTTVYYKMERGVSLEIRVTSEGNIRMSMGDGMPLDATPQEIRAVCKLLDEMGVE